MAPRLSVLIILAVAACRGNGIQLTVENVGQTSLDSVVVFTTGYSYPIGNLEPGSAYTMDVQTRSESNIELEHGQDARRRVVVPTYLEPGYQGAIRVQLTEDSIVAIADSIEIGRY